MPDTRISSTHPVARNMGESFRNIFHGKKHGTPTGSTIHGVLGMTEAQCVNSIMRVIGCSAAGWFPYKELSILYVLGFSAATSGTSICKVFSGNSPNPLRDFAPEFLIDQGSIFLVYNLCTDNNNFAVASGVVFGLGLILLYCCPKTSTDSGPANSSEANTVSGENPMKVSAVQTSAV
jgi:hypothetical protein